MIYQSLDLLTELIDNLTSGILIEDENRIIIRSNKCFSTMFDIPYTPEQMKGIDCNLMGESLGLIVEHPVKFMERVNELLQQRVLVTDDIIKLSNGRTLERDYIPTVINKIYSGHVWHYRDISTKIKIDEYLRKTIEDNSYIIANIGHEIRNPLNCIIGLSDLLLLDENLPDGISEDIKLIKNSGRDILNIADAIMDKASGKGRKYDMTVFDIGEYINEIANSMKTIINKKGLSFTNDNRMNIKNFKGIKINIRQAISNILNNAIKYTDKGHIYIKSWVVDNYIKIQVSDTGVGIHRDKIKEIFKPFYQLDANRQGIGMGLNITLDIVESLGGSIKVESEIGIGSSFIMTIPTNYG